MSAQAYCSSYLLELHQGIHAWGTDTFKLALYTSSASLSKDTTAYSATNEVSGTGYTAGGVALDIANGYPLVQATASGGSEVIIDFLDTVFGVSNLTTRYGLIYNASKSNRAVAVVDFGQDYYVEDGLAIAWPDPNTEFPIMRLGA